MSEVQTPPPPAPGAPGNPPPPAAPAFDAPAAATQLQQLGYAVFAKGQTFTREQAEADPFLKPILDGAIAERFSAVYQDIDRDVFETTGIPKNQGEKTYDYVKRTGAQLKEQIKNTPDVQSVKQTYQKQLDDLKDVTRRVLGESDIRAAVTALSLNVPDEALEFTRQMVINQALSKPFRLNEANQVVFQKLGGEDGKTLIDVNDVATGKPQPAKDYLASEFKSILKVAQPNPEGPNKQPKPANTSTAVPKTMEEVGQQLLDEGYIPGPEFNAEANKRRTQYAIVDPPKK